MNKPEFYRYRERKVIYTIGEFYKGSFETHYIKLIRVVKSNCQDFPDIKFYFDNGKSYALWYFLGMIRKSTGTDTFEESLDPIQVPKQLSLF